MRRAVPALVATVGGLALLANFHTGGTKPSFVAAPVTTPTPTTGAAPPPTNGASPPPTGTPTTQSPSTTAAVARHADGSVVGTQYGDVEVAVSIDRGRITDVQAVELPFSHQRSAEISQQVAPLLRDEVLQAQSAQIDLISGATYTSDAYRQSLQSALDQLRA
jgi:uncharacterized protein with FMN-binding domain